LAFFVRKSPTSFDDYSRAADGRARLTGPLGTGSTCGTYFPELRKRLDEKLKNLNQPYAFRIEGTFSHVKTRSVDGQTPPYRRLIEVIKDQVQFELRDVSGVIVGLRIPDYLTGLSVPGYHFHFLTADRKAGGHLLAFRGSRLHVVAGRCTGVAASIPQAPVFSHVGLTPGIQAEIDQILGRVPIRR
jgi:acetolactate decarboxylase